MIVKGLLAALALLGIYFLLVSLISGFGFAWEQFSRYWYFILALSAGFGVQVGLYIYLRTKIAEKNIGKVIAVSGTTSTLSMVSCCSHYLINILPVIGVTGVITLISQYQIQIFWIGILANLIGIFYIGKKAYLLKKME